MIPKLDLSGVDLEISYDDGVTWEPMRRGFQRNGRILKIDGDIMVQSVGRGLTVWYRATPRTAANIATCG